MTESTKPKMLRVIERVKNPFFLATETNNYPFEKDFGEKVRVAAGDEMLYQMLDLAGPEQPLLVKLFR